MGPLACTRSRSLGILLFVARLVGHVYVQKRFPSRPEGGEDPLPQGLASTDLKNTPRLREQCCVFMEKTLLPKQCPPRTSLRLSTCAIWLKMVLTTWMASTGRVAVVPWLANETFWVGGGAAGSGRPPPPGALLRAALDVLPSSLEVSRFMKIENSVAIFFFEKAPISCQKAPKLAPNVFVNHFQPDRRPVDLNLPLIWSTYPKSAQISVWMAPKEIFTHQMMDKSAQMALKRPIWQHLLKSKLRNNFRLFFCFSQWTENQMILTRSRLARQACSRYHEHYVGKLFHYGSEEFLCDTIWTRSIIY